MTSIWNNKCLIKRNVSKIPNTDVVTNLPVYDLTLSKALSIEICLHKGIGEADTERTVGFLLLDLLLSNRLEG